MKMRCNKSAMKRRTRFGSKAGKDGSEIAPVEEKKVELSKDIPSRIEARESALSVKELATLVGLSDWAIRKQIERGKLPVYRIGDAIQIDPLHAANWLRSTS